MNEACHTYMNEACHTYEWVMSHIWMRHVTHMNEACHTYEWGMSHIWMSHVTRIKESCHTYEGVTHVRMSHVTHLTFCVRRHSESVWLSSDTHTTQSHRLLHSHIHTHWVDGHTDTHTRVWCVTVHEQRRSDFKYSRLPKFGSIWSPISSVCFLQFVSISSRMTWQKSRLWEKSRLPKFVSIWSIWRDETSNTHHCQNSQQAFTGVPVHPTRFHGSPPICIQGFTCVNGVPVNQKIYQESGKPIDLECQFSVLRTSHLSGKPIDLEFPIFWVRYLPCAASDTPHTPRGSSHPRTRTCYPGFARANWGGCRGDGGSKK